MYLWLSLYAIMLVLVGSTFQMWTHHTVTRTAKRMVKIDGVHLRIRY